MGERSPVTCSTPEDMTEAWTWQVKAWCYYESRLLGAHHGLISTYALETMVLYIFMVYHQSVTSPLKARLSP